jgi:serine phosphatase RsbU (regulator of sigma subunit)/integral membrane sensor domain MASE1
MRHGADTAVPLPAFFRTTIGVGSAYFVVGLIGMALAVPPSNATLIFPAAGLAVAAALRFGSPAILAVGLGQFFMHLVRHASAPEPPTATLLSCWLVISIGAAAQAAVAVLIVQLWKGRDWQAAIYEFLFLSGAVSSVVSASVGIGILSAAGFVEPGESGRVWLNWYTGDTLGVFIFAPLTLVLLHEGVEGHATSGDWQVIWRMGAMLALIMVAFLGVRRWEAWAREATLRTDALTIANEIAGQDVPAAVADRSLPPGLQLRILPVDAAANVPSDLRCTVAVPGTNGQTVLEVVADASYLKHRFDVSWAVAILSLVVAGILADRDFVVLSAVNREASTRIEKERFQRDLAIARDIQQGLLPTRPPTVAGFDIAGWNEPADETGGDYFDFVPLSGGRLAVAIADVTGHGIGAALVVAEVRALFRAEILRTPDLLTAVAHVHRLIAGDLSVDRFVTACFAVVSEEQGTVSFLSAGHGPILSYSRARGEVIEHPPHGLPLGFMPDPSYADSTTISLAPGDVFLLLTDGFFEWTNRGGQPFGVERIREFLAAHHDLPARSLVDGLRQAVVDFSGGTPQADDLTAIVVRRMAQYDPVPSPEA